MNSKRLLQLSLFLLVLSWLVTGYWLWVSYRDSQPRAPRGTITRTEEGTLLETQTGRYLIKQDGQVIELK